MSQASRDQNFVPTLLGVSNADGTTPTTVYADPTTHRLLVDVAGGGTGTVTSVSVITANGFAGTVATATTTPAITLTTTITGILKGNGTAISAATAGTDYTALAFKTIAVSGQSDVVADSAADTLTLVGSGITITTDAATDTITFTGAGGGLTVGTTTITSGTTTRILYDNAGVLGEYTISGSGTAVAMAAGATLTTASVNGVTLTTGGSATQFLNGAGSYATPTTTATAITVANEATDTTCFPVFVTAATGDLGPKSNAGLTFNSNTASLGATLMTATTSLTTAAVLASSNDSGALGASGTAFSDLFLASGGVINFAAGNVALTHSTGILTQTAGELRITSANVGTNADSVPTLSSTSTLTNKTLTSPTIQTSPVLAAATSLKFTVPSSDVTATGITTNEFNSGYSSTAIGDLVYLDTSATWQKADADASAATYSSLLGIALSVAASGAAVNVLLQGFIYAATPFPTLTIGAPVYMSATAGAVTQTAPVTTDSATRIVGYAVHADKIWFNPSNDWITHT